MKVGEDGFEVSDLAEPLSVPYAAPVVATSAEESLVILRSARTIVRDLMCQNIWGKRRHMVPRCVALPLERDEYAQGSLAG